jgi:NADP-reducing hydrogenase subunit HndD
MNKMINLTIDGKQVSVPEGTTIMEAAQAVDIHIPRLCYHPDLSLMGSCRVCIVDVKDMGYFMSSCASHVWEGMEVETNSPEIRQARRDIVELLLENHPMDCQTCERDGRCELQNLAYSMGVRERLFKGERKRFKIENSSRSVVRDSEKCVLCGRCVRVCAEIQGVHNLGRQGRGFHTVVAPAHFANMDDSVCIQCGQCINVCPTAAFLEKSSTDEVWAALADPEKHVIVQTAPSIRAAIGEGFGLERGTPATGKMITALRRLGFQKVFDTDLGADLTIVEESNEFMNRLDSGSLLLPLFTSCSPGWISFLEKFYPNLLPYASTCRSPMTMTSVLAKTYYAQKTGIDPAKIFMVAVMPCVAKKFEAHRPEHFTAAGQPYTDAVLTTRGVVWMIKSYGIDFNRLEDGEFDEPLGLASGAGDIFGITGGVMEATLRTAVEKMTQKPAERLDFTEVRHVKGLLEASVQVGNRTLNVAVANGLQNAKTILDRVTRGEKQYHMIEVMACPGGCSGGGGQPYPPYGEYVLDPRLTEKRGQALYAIDTAKRLRRSHENPAIKKIYEEFLDHPGSPKAYELLHTHYAPRLPRGIK